MRPVIVKAIFAMALMVIIGVLVAVPLGASPLVAAPLTVLVGTPTVLIVAYYFR